MKRLCSLLLCLCLASASAHATTFWEDDFENHLHPNWFTIVCGSPASSFEDGCPAPNGPRLTTEVAHGGTHSFLGDFTGEYWVDCNPCPGPTGNPGAKGGFIGRNHTATDEIWVRVWYYRNTAFDPCDGLLTTADKVIYHKTGGGGPSAWWGNRCDRGNGDAVKPMSVTLSHQFAFEATFPFCPEWNSNATNCTYLNNISNPTLSSNTWYCLELNIKFSTTNTSNDGHIRQWVNGAQTMNHSNISNRSDLTSSTNKWKTIQYGQQGGDEGKRFVDDWAVGDTRMGCGESEPTPVPGAPQNLQIN